MCSLVFDPLILPTACAGAAMKTVSRTGARGTLKTFYFNHFGLLAHSASKNSRICKGGCLTTALDDRGAAGSQDDHEHEENKLCAHHGNAVAGLNLRKTVRGLLQPKGVYP